ncbi:MAG TPA: SAM-dependent methyltransferase [Parachlamydiaceae bacterium]|nr:SAM-dependent methyltransferase [Parachlamydiaceae bacterium]
MRGYLAAEGYEKQLRQELQGIQAEYGRLFLAPSVQKSTFWAQNIWHEPLIFRFESISEAASILKSIQRNWALYSWQEHRRAALIEAKLPFISKKPLVFPSKVTESNLSSSLGSWMLLDKHTLLASPGCSSPFPNGTLLFEECKIGPPSRAYLKLWEAFTVAKTAPKTGDRCLEIGASPGGWTWVLANLKCEVLSVDRSELASNVASMSDVHFIKADAFSMLPSKIGAVDWIFSDVACYPEKLLEWVQVWLTSGMCKKFICTLKFQGDANYKVADEFLKISGSRIVHLSHNKHELTWLLV